MLSFQLVEYKIVLSDGGIGIKNSESSGMTG